MCIRDRYTSVGIFAFPTVKVSLYSTLSLYDKTIRFSFPFLNKDRIQLKLCLLYTSLIACYTLQEEVEVEAFPLCIEVETEGPFWCTVTDIGAVRCV